MVIIDDLIKLDLGHILYIEAGQLILATNQLYMSDSLTRSVMRDMSTYPVVTNDKHNMLDKLELIEVFAPYMNKIELNTLFSTCKTIHNMKHIKPGYSNNIDRYVYKYTVIKNNPKSTFELWRNKHKLMITECWS